MELRFPNARLLVYDRILSGSANCASALIQAAYDTGVLERGSVDDWLEGAGGAVSVCSAKVAARKILEETLRKSGLEGDALEDQLERIFTTLEEELADYLAGRRGLNKCGPEDNQDQTREICIDYAPLILDLLLQQHMKR
ncbi:MAG TPA: hypothetical protein PKD05_12735 [Candidatus Melainabacteria bacterium]|nr:hypothetical protein [Candidatus Melainabacteria bacterium]